MCVILSFNHNYRKPKHKININQQHYVCIIKRSLNARNTKPTTISHIKSNHDYN